MDTTTVLGLFQITSAYGLTMMAILVGDKSRRKPVFAVQPVVQRPVFTSKTTAVQHRPPSVNKPIQSRVLPDFSWTNEMEEDWIQPVAVVQDVPSKEEIVREDPRGTCPDKSAQLTAALVGLQFNKTAVRQYVAGLTAPDHLQDLHSLLRKAMAELTRKTY